MTEDVDPVEARVSELLSAMTLQEKISYIGGDRGFYIRPIKRLGIPEIKMADGPAGCRNWGPSTAYPAPLGVAASFDRELAQQVGASIARDCRARGVHVLLAPAVNLQRAPVSGRNFEYLGEDPYLASELAVAHIRGVQEQGVVATVKHFAANNQEWDRNNISSEVDERTLRELYFPAFEAAVRDGEVGAVMTAYNLLNGTYASHHAWLLESVLKEEWGFTGLVMSDWGAVHDTLGAATGGCDLEMPKAEFMTGEKLGPLLKSGQVTQEDLDDKVRRILRTIIRAGFLEGREQKRADVPLDDSASREVALRAARESLVLLKNTDAAGQGMLPLDPTQLARIAVIGPNAHPAVHGGAGSSYVTPFSAVSVLEAVKKLAPNARVTHHPGIQEISPRPTLGNACFSGPVQQQVYAGKDLEGEPVATSEVERIAFYPEGHAPAAGVGAEGYSIRWTGKVRAPRTGRYALMTNSDDGIRVFFDGKKVIDDWSAHAPRAQQVQLQVRAGEHEVVVEYFQGILGAVAEFGFGPVVGEKPKLHGAKELTRIAREANVAIVCVGYNQSWDTNSLARTYRPFWPPDWAREAGLVESEGSDRPFELCPMQVETIQRVAKASPRTIVIVNSGGAVATEGWLDQVQGLLWAAYPGQEGGTAVAGVLFGQTDPGGRLPFSFGRRFEDYPSAPYYRLNEDGKTPYTEGVLMGYGGFDANGIEPLFPFGFGLSYTGFEYSLLDVAPTEEGGARVRFTLKNAGARTGVEVAQVYVVPPRAAVVRAPRSLAGFARIELAPGQTQVVELAIRPRAFAYWKNGWVIEPGAYGIAVGSSSRHTALTTTVALSGGG
jgi:beta-glucosidase